MKWTAWKKQQFYSEFAKLIGAGFGIREAARVLRGNSPPAHLSTLLDAMERGLDGGKSISEAIGDDKVAFSDLERTILAAGERGGRLAEAMSHLSEYFGMIAEARRELLRGLVHPVIALHLGVFIATVPTAMLGKSTGPASMLLSFVVHLLVMYGIVFGLFIAFRQVFRRVPSSSPVDGLIRRVPWIGKARTHLAMAGFCRVYHTCLLAGIPMWETLASAAEASQSGMIRAAASRLAGTLASGHPIGPDMTAEAAFPNDFARSYATGEAAGTLDKDLANWAGYYAGEARASIRLAAAMIPKAAYFLVLGYVAWKIVGFYDSYYGSLLRELE